MSRFLAVFLAAFAPTAFAAGHLLKVEILWKMGMTTAEQKVTVYRDQNVTFSWSAATHNVKKVANKAAFDACTTAGMTPVGTESPVTLGMGSDVVAAGDCVYDEPCYYICGIDGHCAMEQKIAITFKNELLASKNTMTSDTTKAASASGAWLPTLSATAFLAVIVVSTLI